MKEAAGEVSAAKQNEIPNAMHRLWGPHSPARPHPDDLEFLYPHIAAPVGAQ